MPKNTHGTRSELIHCDNCGEDYNNSYKRCPFCGARSDRSAYTQPTSRLDMGSRAGAGASAGRRASGAGGSRSSSSQRPPVQDDDDYIFDGGDVFDDDDDDDYRYGDRRGGKRLSGIGQISPTAIVGFLFSAAVITAAILIIVLVIVPMVQGGRTPPATNTPPGSLPITTSPGPSLPVSPSPLPVDPSPAVTDPVQPTDDPSPSPAGTPSPRPTGGSLTLTYGGKPRTEFTISDAHPAPVQLRVSGAVGTVTWTTSNSAVATVDSTGKVTRAGRGECRVTATDSEGRTGSCRVVCQGSGGTASPAPSPSPSTAPSPSPSVPPTSSSEVGSLTLSKTDITISVQYPSPVTIKAEGASGAVTWTSSNPAVATVDANGKVSKVGVGQCRVTATDASGQTASCVVRCTG